RGRIVVMMSDGTCRIADRSWRDGLSDSVSQATRSHVVIDGERMLIKPRPRPAPVVSPVASGVMPVDEGAGAPVVSAAAGPVQAPAGSGGLADSVAETRANMRRAFSRYFWRLRPVSTSLIRLAVSCGDGCLFGAGGSCVGWRVFLRSSSDSAR